jgi:hypothetical protein
MFALAISEAKAAAFPALSNSALFCSSTILLTSFNKATSSQFPKHLSDTKLPYIVTQGVKSNVIEFTGALMNCGKSQQIYRASGAMSS